MVPPPGKSQDTPAADAQDPTSQRMLSLSLLLKRAVLGAKGQRLGHLADVIVRLRGADYPLVTGIVADIGGGRRVFVPAEAITDWHTEELQLATPKLDLREFERRHGEVLLSDDILDHRLIDIHQSRLVRAYDLQLEHTPAGWVLSGVDIRPTSWWHRLLHRLTGNGSADQEHPGYRDWKTFEALIGHQPSALARRPIARLRRMKPPQIADLLEEASPEEQTELLEQVHTDPELEADVFEELEDDQQSRLLRDRSDTEIAEVLARMKADDAADALFDLPQERRQPVLELLPPGQRVKVKTLLGYNPTTAGGLMSMDYLTVPPTTTAEQVLDRVREARNLAPEALTTVYAVDEQQHLRGSATLVAVLQAAPTTAIAEFADPDPVRVTPVADLNTVTLLMTDYNLMHLPVVDEHDQLIGVITVDDTLEATVPDNWRRREPEPRPEPAEEDPDHPPQHT